MNLRRDLRGIGRGGHLNKLNQEAMWRTDQNWHYCTPPSLGVYGTSNKSNNRRQMPSHLFMENGEVDIVTQCIVLLPMMSGSKEH
jgi:hypothetical protein